MKTEFRRAVLPKEIRSLVTFDHKAFHQHPADWFDRDAWEEYESWWMIIDKIKVGCCAFEPHVDFQEDIRKDNKNPSPSRVALHRDDGYLTGCPETRLRRAVETVATYICAPP